MLAVVLAVGHLTGGHRHAVGEVVHRGDLRHVPRFLERKSVRNERCDVIARRLRRSHRDLLRVFADRRATRIETGASPVERDAVGKDWIAERFA